MITESAAPVITLAGLSVRQRQATIISMGSPMIGADIWKLGKVANPMVSRAKARQRCGAWSHRAKPSNACPMGRLTRFEFQGRSAYRSAHGLSAKISAATVSATRRCGRPVSSVAV